MSIPRWLVFLVAAWVVAFGGFRFYLGLKPQPADQADPQRPNFHKKGLFARSRRSHLAFGLLYLILGGLLVAMGLGWQPRLGIGGVRIRQDPAHPGSGSSRSRRVEPHPPVTHAAAADKRWT